MASPYCLWLGERQSFPDKNILFLKNIFPEFSISQTDAEKVGRETVDIDERSMRFEKRKEKGKKKRKKKATWFPLLEIKGKIPV